MVGDLPKHPVIKVLGVGQARTTGMRRGVVADIEETTRSIRKAIQDAERMAGVQVLEVYSGIAGEHVQAMISKGIVAVSQDEISRSDVERANEVARAVAIPAERELLHAIPQEYAVDKNAGIRDPIGMSGTRVVLHLANELKRRGGGIGAAALCGGGGQGDALIVRVPKK